MQRVFLGLALVLGSVWAHAEAPALDFNSFRPKLVPIPVAEIDSANQRSGLSNCFWVGTISPDTHNILFPDSGVTYWATQFRLPAGAKLTLEGQFPHARHISFNSYLEGAPVDRINDVMMSAVAGATNPFQTGARRDAPQRDYRVNVAEHDLVAGQPLDDAKREPSTLYVPQGGSLHQLYYRVYVPDAGRDARGGVPLPEPVLTLADGKQLRGGELCQSIVVKEGSINDVHLAAEKLKILQNLPSTTTAHHPAQNPPNWNAFFNAPLAASTTLIGTPYEAIRQKMDVTRRGGYYSTLDNTYMSTYIDNRFGDVLVLHAKAATTPKTHDGETTMAAGQLRYWSVCKYRSLSDTAVDSCVHDEQVPTDAQGDYTIVVSSADKRPANARPECGVAWMDWGRQGDGIGNAHGGFLLYRNMIPAADFQQSLFAIHKLGEEAPVMKEYFPDTRYMSRSEFEKRGCSI